MIEYSQPFKPDPELVDFLSNELKKHSLSYLEKPGFQPYAIYGINESKETVGAIIGLINWNWLYVSLLWVHPDSRHHGLGSELLKKMEDFSMTQGCKKAHLDTFSFQAPDFYPRKGYVQFASLEDYPPGHTRFFFKKDLIG